jgi:filamentous hemagglutinin
MQAAQQAARDLARTAPNTVKNGLQAGGLAAMPGATPRATDGGAGSWQGANLPTESANGGRTQVTVKQNEQKAILKLEGVQRRSRDGSIFRPARRRC